ncbi:unnamed protein product [Choristocarpus tenellus]
MTEAKTAASAIIKHLPNNWLGVLTAMSVGALAGDLNLVQDGTRLLYGLVHWPNQTVRNRDLAVLEETLLSIHTALRATRAPAAMNCRALSKAIHLMPTSVGSWVNLGAVLADSAAGEEGRGMEEATVRLSQSCALASEVQVRAALLGTERSPRAQSPGVSSNAGETSSAVVADDLALSLSIGAKLAMCKGGHGSFVKAVKMACRAVHTCPGMSSSWHNLAVALGGIALSSSLTDTGDLRRSYAILSSLTRSACPGIKDNAVLSTAYLRFLLVDGVRREETRTLGVGDKYSQLQLARCAVAGPQPENALEEYKAAVRAEPKQAICWRELARCYLLLDQPGAAMTALECATGAGAGAAGPFYLEMAAVHLRLGQNDECMITLGRAAKEGVEGAAIHVLRGLALAGLGRRQQAIGAFSKARIADPRLEPLLIEYLPNDNAEL